MSEFLRRVRRLQERLKINTPSITLIYADGTERLVRCLEAIVEIEKDPTIVDIRCAGEPSQSLFSVLLEAAQEYGDDFDDLEEVN